MQELVARQLLPAYRARSGKFHGAGREDIDVRMLGRGRPFVFEVVGPRRHDVDLTVAVYPWTAQILEQSRDSYQAVAWRDWTAVLDSGSLQTGNFPTFVDDGNGE